MACMMGQICANGQCRGCQGHAECAVDQVCIDQTDRCELASGRRYEFRFIRLEVPLRNANGSLWDSGGFPDPYIYMKVDERFVGQTATFTDSEGGYYSSPQRIIATITATSRITIEVWDEDFGSDEYIAGGTFVDPISLVRTGGYEGLVNSETTALYAVAISPVP